MSVIESSYYTPSAARGRYHDADATSPQVRILRQMIDIACSPMRNHAIETSDMASSPLTTVANIDTGVGSQPTPPRDGPVESSDAACSPNLIRMMLDGEAAKASGKGKAFVSHSIECHKDCIHVLPSIIFRKDVIFLPLLAPESLGPITLANGQICKTLRGLWEFSRVTTDLIEPVEQSEVPVISTEPTAPPPMRIKQLFFEIRRVGFDNSMHFGDTGNYLSGNTVFHLLPDKNGRDIQLTPLEAKIIYCYHCEQLLRTIPDFERLKNLYEDGYNLQIAGKMTVDESKPVMHPDQLDHSVVIYYMLTETRTASYPWNVEIKASEKLRSLIA